MSSLIEIINGMAIRWSEGMWLIVWQSTALAAIIYLATLCIRRASAAVCFWLWMLVPLRLLVMPLLTISLPLLPAGGPQLETTEVRPPSTELTTMNSGGVIRAEQRLEVENFEPTMSPMSERDSIDKRVLPSIWTLLMTGWLTGLVLCSSRLFREWRRVRRIATEAVETAESKILESAQKARTKLKLHHMPKILVTKGRISPFLFGVFRPVLIVPEGLISNVHAEELVAVLAHEFAHLRRRDPLIGCFLAICETIYFFHPILYLVKVRILFERERACDSWVLTSSKAKSSVYANALISAADICRGFRTSVGPAGAVAESFADLKKRLAAINKNLKPKARLSMRDLVLLVIVGAVCTPGIILTARAEEQAEAQSRRRVTMPLHQAAKNGDIEHVKLLISRGVDVNEKDEKGRTALHCASEKGHAIVASLLISHGAYVNATTSDAKKPLHYAVLCGDKQTVELLLSKGADINAKDRDGRMPLFEAMKSTAAGRNEVIELLAAKGANVPALHLAAYMGDIEKLKKCLRDGIDINSQDNFGCTALHVAVNSGKKNIVEFLIGKGASVDARDAYYGVTPLYYAAMHNYGDMADLLLEKGANVNARDKNGYSLLYDGIWDHNINAVKLLISKGANVNIKDDAGYTPLVYAIWENDKDMVELLIGKGADINIEDNDGLTPYYWASMEGRKDLVELLTAKGATPVFSIHVAAREGDLEKVKRLIEEGADVNMKDKRAGTPLYAAVLADNSDIAEFLISKGADVNVKDAVGRTPLELVILGRGKKNMVELLISKGADVNAKNKWGVTPLHAACVRGQTDVAELLIAKGADLNAKITGGEVGFTPLHFGSFYGHKDVVELLIVKGADIDIKDSNGRTPLHEACLLGHKDVVELLIDGGADTKAKDNKGQITLSLAKEQGHQEIVELLRKHGAKEK